MRAASRKFVCKTRTRKTGSGDFSVYVICRGPDGRADKTFYVPNKRAAKAIAHRAIAHYKKHGYLTVERTR